MQILKDNFRFAFKMKKSGISQNSPSFLIVRIATIIIVATTVLLRDLRFPRWRHN